MKRFILTTLLVLFILTTVLSPFTIPSQGEQSYFVNTAWADAGAGDSSINALTPGDGFYSPGCGVTSFSAIGDCLTKIFALIAQTIFKFVGWILGGAGVVLDFVVEETVIKMGGNLRNVTAITTGWETFRDLANIILIFAFLAIGIGTILQLESYSIGKLLPTLIIVALLVNFSFFFTRAIIDGGNLLATHVYEQIQNCEAESGECNISNQFMESLKLTTLYDYNPKTGTIETTNFVSAEQTRLGDDNIITIALMGSLLFLVTTFVFLTAALLLVTRFVVLIFLIVLSPLAFVAMAVPYLKEHAKKWWGLLINYTIFAPVYFILIWFVLQVIDDFSKSLFIDDLAAGRFTDTVTAIGPASIDNFKIFLNFIIATGFMIAALFIARSLGIAGGNAAINVGNNLRKLAQKGAYRATVRPALRAAKHGAQIVGGYAERSKELAPIINKIPFARLGLQEFAKDYRGDVDESKKSVEGLRTGEKLRRLAGHALPTTRLAILKSLEKSEDLDELSVPEAQHMRKLLEMAGMSTQKLDQRRPDSQTDETKMIAAMSRMRKPADVSALHPVIVSGLNKEIVGRAMVNTFDGGMMAAGARRGDAISKVYMDALFKFAGTSQTERSSEKIAAALNKLGDKNRDIATKAEREGDKKMQAFHEKISARNYAAAEDAVKAPARRLMGLDPNQGSQRQSRRGRGSRDDYPDEDDQSGQDDQEQPQP